MRDDVLVKTVREDPAQRLAFLPLETDEKLKQLWLQDAFAWLKSIPPASRAEHLQNLAGRLTADLRPRFRRIWVDAFAPGLFAEAGLPKSTSLVRELARRIQRRILPQLESKLDLCAALHAAELEEGDADWIANLSEEDALEWAPLVGATREDIFVALRLLAIQAAAIGLSVDVMKVMPHGRETETPFYNLVDAVSQVGTGCEKNYCVLEDTVLDCKLSAGVAHARLEEQGVSSDLVFKLDLVISQLDRMDVLLRLAQGKEGGRPFSAMLVRGLAEEQGIHGLVRNSVNRLARRIVEHTGKSGEHYIASSRSEWWMMGRGAVGGGGVTAFTAFFKYVLGAMPLAPLWMGVAHSINYTASFVFMQLLSWPLASKMPSMTAAALAHAMEKEDGMHAEVGIVAAICRTQWIVTLGNLVGAIGMSLIVDLIYQLVHERPFLGHDAALHGLDSMRFFGSLTIPFAAMTGCFLWVSSLVAGLTANWMARHDLPAAVAQSRRLRRLLGTPRAIKFGELLKNHLSGIAGYICLGLLLGLLPFVSIFAGLPVEVRHVTLASASLTYDLGSLASSGEFPWGNAGSAALGVAATGICNFAVSFALGLLLAMRARRLDARGRKMLGRALWRELRRDPARFLWQNGPEPQPNSSGTT